MNRGMKSSLGLTAKIIIILLLPLLLFRYVDSQPTAVANDEDDEGTRNVAIVNEDNGYVNKSEEISLGQDISSLLSDSDDYTWVVANRSSAEQGFSSGKYDAILYVPSSFSENVMTFKDASPVKASINYVIQPNLVAKERQRVHREMANAKNMINQEMSTIYWSYVSQEVDNIREQFDDVLDKEIAFQDAMYSFYAPSSETLANEIDNHKGRLENILNQTERVHEVSSDNASSATDAEDKLLQFTEALDAYKENQFEQQQLLEKFQAENIQMVDSKVQDYKEGMENYLATIDDQMNKYESPAFNQNDNLDAIDGKFHSINQSLDSGAGHFSHWNEDSKGNTFRELVSLNESFLKEYNQQQTNEAKEQVLSTLGKLSERDDKSPDLPKERELELLDFEALQDNIQSVRSAVGELEESIGEPVEEPDEEPDEEGNEEDKEDDNDDGSRENEGSEEEEEKENETIVQDDLDWNIVYDRLDEVDLNIDELIENNSDVQGEWESYIEEWEDAYQELEEIKNDVSTPLINKILNQQSDINDYKVGLKNDFLTEEELQEKAIKSLVDYSNDLEKLREHLLERSNIGPKMVENLLTNKAMRDKLADFYNLDDELKAELEGMFDELVGDGQSGEVDQLQNNFNVLVEDTYDHLDNYEEIISDEFLKIDQTIKDLNEETSLIGTELSEVNNESFEWDESPSLEYLDGQMVFQFQQGTASSLKNLSDLVASLDENQNNITSDTEELQSKVGSVQDESDELNQRWSTNVQTTEQVRDDVYDVLNNTMVDGQTNPFIYNYLSNPVNVEGQVDGQVLSESEDRMPPVVLFIIILLSGLLIGFLSQYYSKNSYLIQGGLFVLLNLSVGLIISMYGLNIYPLDDSQAIMWSAFTIILLMACSNLVRGGLFIGPFVGWLVNIALILFFISPLLDIVVPEFSFNNPISDVYMGLLYGSSSSYALTMTVMAAVILIVSALIYGLQMMKAKPKDKKPDEQTAS